MRAVDCRDRDAYLDGSLDREAAAAFATHRADCGACATALAQWSGVAGRLRDWAEDDDGAAHAGARARLLAAARAPRGSRRGRGLWVGLGLAGAAAAAAASFYLRPPPAPSAPIARVLTVETQTARRPVDVPVEIRSTGAPERARLGRHRLVVARGRLRVLEATERGAGQVVEVVLDEGLALFDVDGHTQPVAWRVAAGALRVRVRGTQFAVEHDAAEGDTVAVVAGSVDVETGGRTYAVEAGQALRVARETVARERLDADALAAYGEILAGPQSASEPSAERVDPKPHKARRAGPAELATWKRWIIGGDLARAEAALRDHLAAAPADQAARALLGDALRKAGRAEAAVAEYRRVIAQGGPLATRARFLAGTLLEGELSQPAAALPLLERFAAEAEAPEVAAAALMAVARAQRRLGRAADADATLRTILETWPETPAAVQSRQLLEGPR